MMDKESKQNLIYKLQKELIEDLTKTGTPFFSINQKKHIEDLKCKFKITPETTDKEHEDSGTGYQGNKTLEDIAGELLEREFGETMVYNKNVSESLFIPQEFISQLYKNRISIVDHDIRKCMKITLKNRQKESRDHWFTIELEKFLEKTDGKDGFLDQTNCTDRQDSNETDCIDVNEVLDATWIKQIKVLCVIHDSMSNIANHPEVADRFEDFLENCKDFYQLENDNTGFMEMYKDCQSKNIKKKNDCVNKWLNNRVKQLKSIPEDIFWFFNLSTEISGEIAERYLYDELGKVLKGDFKQQFVVLHGADIMIPGCIEVNGKIKKQQEYDFLLFSPKFKTIIAIEVKFSIQNDKAIEQLNTYKKIFEEKFGNHLRDWDFFPVVFEYNANHDINSPHYINPKKDLRKWLENVCETLKRNKDGGEEAYVSLQNVLKLIYFAYHISKTYIKVKRGPLVSSNFNDWVLEAIDVIGTSENIIFYSPEQLPIMLDDKYKKVVIIGGFGTGKSILLQKKCEMIASTGEKADYFICARCEKKTLFQIFLEEKWKNNPNINVRMLEFTFYPHKLINCSKNVFVDEIVEFTSSGLFTRGHVIEEALNMFNRFDHAWLSTTKEHFKRLGSYEKPKFHIFNLSYIFRNTKNVANSARDNNMMPGFVGISPENFPEGVPVNTTDDLEEFCNIILKKSYIIIFYHTDDLFITEVLKYLKYEKELKSDKIGLYTVSEFMNEYFEEYTKESTQCLSFLKAGNSLIVDDTLVDGFEWPNIVITEDIKGSNMICRGMVNVWFLKDKNAKIVH